MSPRRSAEPISHRGAAARPVPGAAVPYGYRRRSCASALAPRFRSYVRERNVRSYDYDGRVAVGTTLPASGVTYYDVPNEYRVQPGYRYTVVNDRPVLVDRGHRIVEVID